MVKDLADGSHKAATQSVPQSKHRMHGNNSGSIEGGSSGAKHVEGSFLKWHNVHTGNPVQQKFFQVLEHKIPRSVTSEGLKFDQ